ncbi:hypothetical protein [Streptomyces xanthophaeus]
MVTIRAAGVDGALLIQLAALTRVVEYEEPVIAAGLDYQAGSAQGSGP